ncbi:MAG: hypothetical protein AABW81_04045 [Nanoarchaeota archaeon]
MREADYKKKIVEYFKKNISKGYPPEALKWALIKQGYSRSAVEKSLDVANQEIAATAPILKEKPVITHEVFDEGNNAVSVNSSFLNKFKPHAFNVFVSLIIVGIGYLIGVFTKYLNLLTKPLNLLVLFVVCYIIVSLVKEVD